MATIAIHSMKGGVGKSTLAVNLAWCAAALSARRTLLWDLDPQGAASWMLGCDVGRDRARALFSRDVPVTRLVVPSAFPRLDLLAADASLRELDHLFRALDKKRRLRRLVAELGEHEVVVLDCPPGLTETTGQVARAADLIVVPVIPSALAQRAFLDMERHLNGRVRLMPVHVMVDRRRALHVEAVERHADWPAIPAASVVEAAAAHRLPLGAYAPRAPAAAAFARLWRTIERHWQ